ncbi:CHAP domain-containing protein [Streptomyces sp. IBSBF 3010]|uniref:CHAP domain-containing protein n=1 Tax=Streptomyces sp. IBSBF 3010 TaxID=2903526 RepID=UPI002FDC56D1
MASTAAAMLKAAAADVGYKEGKNNDTKHGRWYGLNFNPWCDMAVSMWADQSGNADVVGKFAYCPSHVNWFKERNQWVSRNSAVKAGDIVFFTWDGGPVADHVGVVTEDAPAGADVKTIEANTSAGTAGSQGNGDGVYRRTRGRNVILGFGRPAYKKAVTPSKPTVDLSELIRAAKLDPKAAQGHQTYAAGVKVVEAALKAEGFLAAKYAGDGSFGTTTVEAYRKWQKALGYKGADADGIPGTTSLTRLGAKHGFNVKP